MNKNNFNKKKKVSLAQPRWERGREFHLGMVTHTCSTGLFYYKVRQGDYLHLHWLISSFWLWSFRLQVSVLFCAMIWLTASFSEHMSSFPKSPQMDSFCSLATSWWSFFVCFRYHNAKWNKITQMPVLEIEVGGAQNKIEAPVFSQGPKRMHPFLLCVVYKATHAWFFGCLVGLIIFKSSIVNWTITQCHVTTYYAITELIHTTIPSHYKDYFHTTLCPVTPPHPTIQSHPSSQHHSLPSHHILSYYTIPPSHHTTLNISHHIFTLWCKIILHNLVI